MDQKRQHMVRMQELLVGYQVRKHRNAVAGPMSFDLPAGSLISLIGPNGVGKSTLIRTLCGVQPPLEGTIEISGMHLDQMSSLERAKSIAVVLTEAPASRNLTAAEFITLGRYPHTNWMGKMAETDRESIERAMRDTDTWSLANKRCIELSDGQMQRVAIARALAQDTPLILLDEPLTHLDLYHRAAVLKLLRELVDRTGKLILFSTHEIDLAISHSDQMILMSQQGVFFDRPDALISAGYFDHLFPGKGLEFDAINRRFKL